MRPPITLRPAVAADLDELAAIIALAFASPPADVRPWLETAGLDRVRTLRLGDDVAGSVLVIPMAHYLYGRPVPTAGIAGVAIAPHLRGRGLGAEAMRLALAEIRAGGTPLSSLYASTQSLYRRVGYEQAGHWCEVRIPMHRLDGLGRGAPFRPYEERDQPAVETCYNAFASLRDGYLQRSEYVWNRVRRPRGESAAGFVHETGDAIDAYVFLQQRRDDVPGGRHNLHVTDLAASSPAGARAAFAFLRVFSSMAEQVIWHAGPAEPLLTLLPEHRYHISTREHWMLRLVDVPGALAARAYPPGLAAEIHLDVADESIPANAGPLVLTVADGAAKVAPGGDARVRLDVRALASVYTGFHAPRALAALGLIEGPDADLDALTAAFAGSPPSMADMF